MHAEPHENHRWLMQLVGEWDLEADAVMGPDQPPQKMYGKETVRPLGDLWIIAEGEGEMPAGGDVGYTRMTLGYDPNLGRFVGSWVGSMMTNQWIYEGELDAARKVLPLNTQGPAFDDQSKLGQFRDIIEIVGPNERLLRSEHLGPDGKWQQFMTARYRRRAATGAAEAEQ